jgi:hypothetical protein
LTSGNFLKGWINLEAEHDPTGIGGVGMNLIQLMRLLIAEYCLAIAIRAVPQDCDDGIDLVKTVREYLKRSASRQGYSSF